MFDWLRNTTRWLYATITLENEGQDDYEIHEIFDPDESKFTVKNMCQWIINNYPRHIANKETKIRWKIDLIEFNPNE